MQGKQQACPLTDTWKMPIKKGQGLPSLPQWGTSPANKSFAVSEPRWKLTSTGATASLEIHKMNRHCRKNGGHKRGQHVPEEVLHGCILLSENVPTPVNLYNDREKHKPHP